MQLSIYDTFKATVAVLLSYHDSESTAHTLFTMEQPIGKAFPEQA